MGAVPILKKHTIYELLNGFLYKEELIPTSFLKAFIDSIGASQNTAAKLLGIATRTLQRELNSTHLSSELSDRFLQLMDLYKEGLEAFYDLDTFKQWLATGKSAFHGKKPFELMHSITGIQQVKEEIIRTKLGILS
ncbi:hypothetical protein C900_03835 [Fulvivirga imtechensis AK7]|uniref:Uncharacterized protein n=1 Tax=Fulvivirga imtechensis AK7 TaxID=1237149 RepID=L8JMT9_9BACT|nr:antitoxin Xre/MbcA/ParS toxin-binding domain-containing protein [Fulvivirga imtechensis]ELR70150.1 hypothetical protein C900_03835 [Fulvivirga imtechensis AK7]